MEPYGPEENEDIDIAVGLSMRKTLWSEALQPLALCRKPVVMRQKESKSLIISARGQEPQLLLLRMVGNHSNQTKPSRNQRWFAFK